jgi:hypothetical protein
MIRRGTEARGEGDRTNRSTVRPEGDRSPRDRHSTPPRSTPIDDRSEADELIDRDPVRAMTTR